jgi:hypothetical protein
VTDNAIKAKGIKLGYIKETDSVEVIDKFIGEVRLGRQLIQVQSDQRTLKYFKINRELFRVKNKST